MPNLPMTFLSTALHWWVCWWASCFCSSWTGWRQFVDSFFAHCCHRWPWRLLRSFELWPVEHGWSTSLYWCSVHFFSFCCSLTVGIYSTACRMTIRSWNTCWERETFLKTNKNRIKLNGILKANGRIWVFYILTFLASASLAASTSASWMDLPRPEPMRWRLK